MSTEQRRMEELGEQIFRHVFGEPPRTRYFQKGDGPMFSWLVKRFEGRWASMLHWPKGPGSLSGNASMWVLVEECTTLHDRRSDGKDRALRMYRAWENGATLADFRSGDWLDKVPRKEGQSDR